MKSKNLDINAARLLVSHQTELRAAVSRAPRSGECMVLFYRIEEGGEGAKKKIQFYELKLANEAKGRIFKSLDAAVNAIFDGVKLPLCHVFNADMEQTKAEILKRFDAEERR